jgi:hypothetical protein
MSEIHVPQLTYAHWARLFLKPIKITNIIKENIMNLELDHFFILVKPKAEEADLLVELGLEESYSRVHPGQGTTNRCFKFSNSMMELLWLHDEQEAEQGPAANMHFAKRAQQIDASPFGLVFNRKKNIDAGVETTSKNEAKQSLESHMPFNGWTYQPDYFPAPKGFHVAQNSENIREPLCIYMPFVEPMERSIEVGKFKSISHVQVAILQQPLSNELIQLSDTQGLSIVKGPEHLMEVTFDQGACGLTRDLRSTLSLIVHW